MTSPLLNPVSGYSTLLRFDSVSSRPSTSTATFSDFFSGLTDHLVRRLVRAQPAPAWVSQSAVAGPLAEADFADDLRRDPVRVLGVLARYDIGERRVLACQRLQLGLEVAQHLVREAGADVPGVRQRTLVVGHTEQQRPYRTFAPTFARLP